VRHTERGELAMQPVYDLAVPRYAAGRTLLAGDAGALARPHVGSGVTKAVHDALAIRRLSAEHDDWTSLLAGYDRARTAPAAALVELGRRLGTAHVERTPPWSSMISEDYEKWFRSTVEGQSPGYWP
jgi:2-polyprenyl-6-methoxyphenol hydroxylase-like FAD-dependent oxidoreductase